MGVSPADPIHKISCNLTLLKTYVFNNQILILGTSKKERQFYKSAATKP